MRSIKQLIKTLRGERPLEYQAFHDLDDSVQELLGRIERLEKQNLIYYCTAYRDTDQNIPGTGASTNISFTNTVYPQCGNMHDDTVDNDKIFIRRDGLYVLSGNVHWDLNAAGTRFAVIDYYGPGGYKGFLDVDAFPGNASVLWHGVKAVRYLFRDDYVTLRVNNSSGVPLDVLTNPVSATPHLSVVEIRLDIPADLLGLLNPDELIS